MKKLILLLSLTCLLIGISLVPTIAAPNPDDGIYGMAQYFPASTELFAVTRIDEGFVEDLDNMITRVSGMFADMGIPSMNLSQTVQMTTGIDLHDLLAWMGDYAAVGQYLTSGDVSEFVPSSYYVVILLDDPAGADGFLSQNLAGMSREETDDGIVFSDGILEFVLIESTLIAYSNVYPPTIDNNSLLTTDKYREAVSALPLDHYDGGIYVDLESLFTAQIPPEQLEVIDSNLGGLAVGFTSIDDHILIADVAHAPLEATVYDGSGRVDSAFLSKIPDTVTSLIVGSDLSHVISNSINEVNTIDERMDNAMQVPDVNEAFAMVGIDFQADILDWMTGEYAVFGDVDLVPIVKDALAYELNLTGRVDLGIVADASTNPAAANRLADSLSGLMAMGQSDETYTLRQEVIAGTEVTVIAFNTDIQNPFIQPECGQPPAMSPLSFELVLGVTDDLFVFATRPLADSLLSGDYQGISSTATYQTATQYFLPDPTSIWYTDGEGFIYSVVVNPIVTLGLLGPSIGCIFDNIVAQLNSGSNNATPTATPTPLPSPTPDFQQTDQQVRPLELVQSLIHSASITSTITDNGVILVRFVIIYNQ